MVQYDIDVLTEIFLSTHFVHFYPRGNDCGFSLDKRLSEILFPTFGSSYRKCVHGTSSNIFNIVLNCILKL